jgi:hypothetical protein
VTLGSFAKITQTTQILWLLFSTVKIMQYFSQKNGLGFILGHFFTNASGHPGAQSNADRKLPFKNSSEFFFGAAGRKPGVDVMITIFGDF